MVNGTHIYRHGKQWILSPIGNKTKHGFHRVRGMQLQTDYLLVLILTFICMQWLANTYVWWFSSMFDTFTSMADYLTPFSVYSSKFNYVYTCWFCCTGFLQKKLKCVVEINLVRLNYSFTNHCFYFYSRLKQLYISNKMVCFSYRGGCGVRTWVSYTNEGIKAFKRIAAGLGYK